MDVISTPQKKAIAAASIVVCVGVLAYQLSNSALLIQDSIARWAESATSWAWEKPPAGETIADVVRNSLEKPAPAAQLTSAAVSSDCNQVNQLTSGTALVGDRLTLRFFEREAVKSATMTGGTSPLYFERLDLSGTYEVDAQGEVSLPLLGRLQCLDISRNRRH